MSTQDIKWDKDGLVAAIVTDSLTQEVLVLAWMNAEALAATLETGVVHFYSRSRKCLWQKGETSGNTLAMVSVRFDCDVDAALISATPAGPTCHTGRRSCFFRQVDPKRKTDGVSVPIVDEDQGPGGAPSAILDRLYKVLESRRDDSTAAKSYTRSLMEAGFPKIEAKISEESAELLEVLAEGDESKVIHESADLIFHMMVGLCARGIEAKALWAEFDRRFGTGGHEEKASR